jgi:hypothetical protein
MNNKIKIFIDYVAEFDHILLFVTFYKVLEIVIVLLSIILFALFYWKSVRQIDFNYYKSLPIKNKFLLIWFTIFFAIPNKIWVSNKVPSFLTSIVVFLIIVLSNVFPLFILIYINFWVTTLESYFFAVLYEEKITFKNFVNRVLFQSNTIFAKEYFTFFWGNMNSGGGGKGRAGIVGTFFGGLYKLARDHEKNIVRERGKEETARHIANSEEKPKTPREAFELQKDVENHVLERDTTILTTEKVVKGGLEDAYIKIKNWLQED